MPKVCPDQERIPEPFLEFGLDALDDAVQRLVSSRGQDLDVSIHFLDQQCEATSFRLPAEKLRSAAWQTCAAQVLAEFAQEEISRLACICMASCVRVRKPVNEDIAEAIRRGALELAVAEEFNLLETAKDAVIVHLIANDYGCLLGQGYSYDDASGAIELETLAFGTRFEFNGFSDFLSYCLVSRRMTACEADNTDRFMLS